MAEMSSETALPQAVQELIEELIDRDLDGVTTFASALRAVALRALEGRAQAPALVDPCRCGHEKGNHQTRIGRGNYTPCCETGCKCDGFKRERRGIPAPSSTGAATPQEK